MATGQSGNHPGPPVVTGYLERARQRAGKMLDMSPAGDILSLRGDNSGRMRFLALPSRIGETYRGIDLHSEGGWNSSGSRWITCPSRNNNAGPSSHGTELAASDTPMSRCDCKIRSFP